MTVYPDFTILKMKERREIIWEHFGMMDKPDYQEAAIKKLSRYYENGYFDGKRIWYDAKMKKIEAYLAE